MRSHRKHSKSHQHKNSLSTPFSQHSTSNGSNDSDYNNHNNGNETSDDDFDDEDGVESGPRTLDFSKVLQDVEGSLVGTMTSSVVAVSQLLSSTPSSSPGSSFRVTWKEMLYLVLAIVILAGLSIFLGVAAGITISIHYFDTHTTTPPPQRVTLLDYGIVATNVMSPIVGNSESMAPVSSTPDLTLGRVITMSESGQRSVLLVVEETNPLHADFNNQNTSSTNQTHPTTSMPPLSSENDDEDEFILLNGYYYKPHRLIGPPHPNYRLSASTVHPTICSDGVTIGFDKWLTLKAAVEEANSLSAERFMKWNEFFASLDKNISSSAWFDNLVTHNHNNEASQSTSASQHNDIFLRYYYDQDIIFTICPGVYLRTNDIPIFINAENVIIECGDPDEHNYLHASKKKPATAPSIPASFSRVMPTCTLDASGTHMAFGPHARNVLVRGLVYQSSKKSSLNFYYDGAQASFEDCVWMDPPGGGGGPGTYGAVADINSTSTVNFYRCEIGPSLAGVANFATPGPGPTGPGGNMDPPGGAGGPYVATGPAPGGPSFTVPYN